jgi:hypothetical protein
MINKKHIVSWIQKHEKTLNQKYIKVGITWSVDNPMYNPNLYEKFFIPQGKYKTPLWKRDKQRVINHFLALSNNFIDL